MDILNAKGKPLRNSASAVETWLDCKRKWAYGYYWRVEQARSAAAEVGSKVHDVLDKYLSTGEKPEDLNNRYWRIAEPGVQYLPEVGEDGVLGNWYIEEWVKCQCGPLPFVGKVDLYNLEDFDNIQIDDHKTTGDGSWRWAKTPSQLAKLIQPHAYGWCIIKVHGLTPPESVDFRHINYCTKGEPKAMEVRARNVPWIDIEETWNKLEIISTQMAELAIRITEPEEVEATTTSCKKYGGCPYATMCKASPLNRDKIEPHVPISLKGEPKMNDRLTALRAQLGVGHDTNNGTLPVSVTRAARKPVEDPQGDVQSLANKLSKAVDKGSPIPIAAAEAMARSADVHLYEALGAAGLHNKGGHIVKTENNTAPKVGHGTITDMDPVVFEWLEYLKDNDSRMSRKAATDIIKEMTGAQRVRKQRIDAFVEEFNEACDEGRLEFKDNVFTLYQDTSSDFPAKDSEVAVPDTILASESDALDEAPIGRIVKEVATPTIYIDCIPEDPAGVFSFTDFVRPFEQQVEKDGGKVNDQFTQPLPYYGILDYGQGPKRVAGKVLAALHRAGPMIFSGDLYVDSKHPLADEIIPVLRRLKGVRVVRASR